MAITLRSFLSLANRVVRAVSSTAPAERTGAPARRRPAARSGTSPASSTPGRRRMALLAYSPTADGKPDPGEIVWTWVPYEEDYSQGKDRPVLLIGRDGRVRDCRITRSSGIAALDGATCQSAARRLRWSPARDTSGGPVEAWVPGDFEWLPRQSADRWYDAEEVRD